VELLLYRTIEKRTTSHVAQPRPERGLGGQHEDNIGFGGGSAPLLSSLPAMGLATESVEWVVLSISMLSIVVSSCESYTISLSLTLTSDSVDPRGI